MKVDVSKNSFLPVWVRLTRLGQVIRLLVGDTRRPPPWLCQLRVNTLRCSSNILPSIIRVVDLLARLNQLDPCLGNHSTVELLEVVERLLVVPSQDVVISHAARCGGWWDKGRLMRNQSRDVSGACCVATAIRRE